MSGPTTVVLVPGAWHGPWCWASVRELLEARGLRTRAVDLPSTFVESAGFAADVGAVRSCLDDCDGPVLLVGHSYGGAVVTEAGEHPAVRALVFVAAFNLHEGESPTAAAVEESTAIVHEGRPQLDLVDIGGGRTTITADSARVAFYGDCAAEAAAHAIGLLRPQQMSCLSASPAAVAWRTRPSTYVVCERDNAVHPDLQRILAQRADRQVALPSGHSPFLSMPERVADVLVAAAAEVGDDPR